ncbi:MAG: class I SAM-dependent methyltransferase [Ruminococcus flavefaciens]|nr:class I SAM-dependent methyltransferase [Ruminococcus flavefaciens]
MNIDYSSTKRFFKGRADNFPRLDNPYSVTMYQDNNPGLVIERNKREIEKLLPLMKINENTKFLDIGCGIGRWADALPESIHEYCGIDFSDELIAIADKRNTKSQFSFLVGEANEIEETLEKNKRGLYNRILMIGILLYLNDDDMKSVFEQVERICQEHAVLCIREPIAIEERLTLRDFFSEELNDYYNAIYRTREELGGVIDGVFVNHGFKVEEEGFLFEDSLNNRRETAQYYFVLER